MIFIMKINTIKYISILEESDFKLNTQKIKEDELKDNIIIFENRLKMIKKKISKIKTGTILEIKGIKKVYKHKIEKRNIFKMIEEEFNEYCQKQINWAKTILDDNYSDCQIIKLLDILNKLNGNYNSISSSSDINSDSEIYKRYNKRYNNIKSKKIEEFKEYCDFGKDFINDGINSKKDIPEELLEIIKESINSSDINYGKKDEKINRFINQCKRYYILSQKIKNTDNIIKSKLKTNIRDISNKDFDNLLLLLDNKNSITQRI